ncbi:hypothetical protein [Phyllobacterium zundukense]|uniref:Uncharacterized protein n=1 Tax=Phyllobacterium zundukense TaxID=1867719 RepID=A0A2N9W3C4_9HYPH|nr:hypothetical protein [Phyllobacterium zundukense]ATU91700.1 hypothetical protein BLM14_08750 [Phyllobacterium zundukense]PIO46242.1 hypothetical protein B5P45_03330 [Phyllobacterium zundukense]
MQFPRFDGVYSQEEWRILALAHHRACQMLERDPQFHPLAERVARTIMIFFERGERDFGRLADMAAKRERRLPEDDDWSDAGFLKQMLLARSGRPQDLH